MSVILRVFTSWRMVIVLMLGFSSGFPLAITGSTLQAWMRTEQVDLKVIGLFSLVGLPYLLKFLWSPLMDRFSPSFLGRYRGWMVVSQVALMLTIMSLAFSKPVQFPWVTAFIALLISFFSASQDIVIDAYRTDFVEQDELGPAAALFLGGYRIATLVSGGVALILADFFSWQTVYFMMAAAMGLGIVVVLFAPTPQKTSKPPKSLTDAIVIPFTAFFKKKGAGEILAFILIYKLDVVIATALLTPFLMDIGFSKTDIGAVFKGFGLAATLFGTFVGGALMIRLGVQRSLWTFGLGQGFSGLAFIALAHLGHSYPMMVIAIALEQFCSGMGTAAFMAFLMRICDKRYTTTQYALLSSVMATSRVVLGAPTGYLAEAVGWEGYFLISVLAMIPGLLLLTRYSKWALTQTEV